MPDFLDRAGALRVAMQALAGRWPQLGELAGTAGEPALVHTVSGEPSYWTVPVLQSGRVVGFLRVLGDGRMAASGVYGAAMPGVSADEAARSAGERLHADETALEPLFVHDGPPGREVWLVRVRRGGRVTRWLFVAPGGVYERPAGEPRDESRE